MEENNDMLGEIAETIGSDFTAYIEDGVFRITPPEAGIAIFAALSGHAEQLQDAWDATDELVIKLEEVREEAAKLRDYLESLQLYLDAMGCDEKVSEIDHLLWPVVGVLEDGTEVQFEYVEIDPLDRIKCTYCVQGLTCSCEAAIECDYCSQGFWCDCGGAE
jgi:hypothetical protein